MKLLYVYLPAALLLASMQANAQKQVLKTAIDKTNSYKSISYQQTDRQKSPFTNDWTTLKYKAATIRNSQADSVELYDYHDLRGYRTVYNGNLIMSLDIANKTYEIRKMGRISNRATPYKWARYIKDMLALQAAQIKLLPDTVINQAPCFHVKRVLADLPANKNISDLYLDKKTYLPVFIRELMQGRMSKGNEVDDKITTLINEYTYTGYRINVKGLAIASFTIPPDYVTEKKVAMLAAGDKAPDWTLKNSSGVTVSGKQFTGKVVLLDFSFNECAACMLSIPVLNRLHEKYKGSNVEIATVNTSNTKESVAKFARKNNINYPILLNGSRVSKSFQVSAYPSFYIIDKQGNVAASFEGYDKTLESSLITLIDKLR